MKNLHKIILLTLVVLSLGCQEATILEPIEVTQLEKTNPNAGGVFRLYQDFHNIPVEYEINNTNIEVVIQNRHLYDISSHLFAIITYQNNAIILYLNKPTTINFIIPYYGTTDITNITIYAIFEYVEKELDF